MKSINEITEIGMANPGFPIMDNSPQIQIILIAGYRSMSPQQKLKRVDELTKAVQKFALARIRPHYGDISKREQHLRLTSFCLDRETMLRVFKLDQNIEGVLILQ